MKIATEKGIVNTEKALVEFDLDRWNGSNWQSGQGLHETLYKSKKNIWYVLHTSQWQGAESYIEFVSENESWEKLIDSDCEYEEFTKYFDKKFVNKMEDAEI